METKCPNCGRRMFREGSEHHLKFLERQQKKQQSENQPNKPKISEPKIEEKSTLSKEQPADWKPAPKQETAPKKQEKLRIAFPTDDGVKIALHVGRAEGYYIVEIQGSTIVSQKYYTNPDKEHHHHDDNHFHSEHIGAGREGYLTREEILNWRGRGYGRGMGRGRGMGHGRGRGMGAGRWHDEHHHHHHDHDEEDHDHRRILNLIGDCDIIIVKHIGWRLATDLTNLGIKIYITRQKNIKDALNDFIAKEILG